MIVVIGSETVTGNQQQTTNIYLLPKRKMHKFDVIRDINSEYARGSMQTCLPFAPFIETKYPLLLRRRGGNAQTVSEIVCEECNLT